MCEAPYEGELHLTKGAREMDSEARATRILQLEWKLV